MAKQSRADRLLRLSEGRCPVHGLRMPRVDKWYFVDTDEPDIDWDEDSADRETYTIFGCPRKDCGIKAKASSFDGPWELLEEWKYLLNDSENMETLMSERSYERKNCSLRKRHSH